MKALDNITINQKYGLVLKEDIEKTNCVISNQKKQIERLQEQLNDANKVIKKYSDDTIYLFPTWYNGSRLAEAYLKKWGALK